MFPNWQLMLLSICYIGLLFLIAYLGDKYKHLLHGKRQAIIYAFAVSVYCTSWSFLGTTGQAAQNVLSYLPIYLGPILLLVFAWPFLQRIIDVSLKFNLTSIADLLAARFGKSHGLAILVTLVSIFGTLPYIALQIKAIVYSFQQLQLENIFMPWQLGLVTSLVLAGFSMLFGIRSIDVTERHPGIMLAIAFEALVKIAAFASVGVFICFMVFDSPQQIWQIAKADANIADKLEMPDISSMLGMLVIVMAAFFVLPRQFHVMVVELKDNRDSWLSRRLFPIYLLVFAFFSAPLGIAGHLLLDESVPADMYVLVLPWYQEQMWLTLFAFLGAISAASSMVIVSTIALSTMLSNEVVFPILFKNNRQPRQYAKFRSKLLNIRKTLVTVIIFLGYGVFLFTPPTALSSLGEIALGAIAQLFPALVVAFYWRSATLKGVFSGIVVAFSLWVFANFLPQFNVYESLFSVGLFSTNTAVNVLCLGLNTLVTVIVSLASRSSVQERVQVSEFLKRGSDSETAAIKVNTAISVDELLVLCAQFVGDKKARTGFMVFENECNRKQLNQKEKLAHASLYAEKLLTTVMGSSSARLVLSSALDGKDFGLGDLAQLVENASSHRQDFSQKLLRSAIENANEGMSIINDELQLVAWNSQYVAQFNYPENMLFVGCPIARLIRHNAESGLCGPGEIEFHVQKRLNFLRSRDPHHSERTREDGRVIRMEGNPLPDGGFLMVFSDITAFREAERVLQQANQDLESRVIERTLKLEETNQELARARELADQALSKKSHYLQVCSHDLLQPLEAARLFASALSSQPPLTDIQQRQIGNINESLKVANEMIMNLAEVARIESGNIKPQWEIFSLNQLFNQLREEFTPLALQHQVEFTVMPSKHWVQSDKHLLRRILQNLIGNAFRYASPGKVLLGCRKKQDQLHIQVMDNGPGIPIHEQQHVFEQFSQLKDNNGSVEGLGLGLSICQSLACLLNHPINLCSRGGRGCSFSLRLDPSQPVMASVPEVYEISDLTGTVVLCVDNNPAILDGMIELMASWQCEVYGASSILESQEILRQQPDVEIVLADYQLDNDEDGLTLITSLRELQAGLPAILITATAEEGIQHRTESMDVGFMRKLVKPSVLREMMAQQLKLVSAES